MSRARSDVIVGLALVVGLIVLALVMSRGLVGNGGDFELSGGGEKIGLIEVLGPIYDARQTVQNIDKFRKRDDLKALVIRFDSPGGAVAASEELYRAVSRAAETKPVVASYGNVSASGAYYASLGADSIFANAGSTTGSIGVLLEYLTFGELLDNIGVEPEIVKTGRFKDAGNPSRELTDEERAYFQAYIEDAFASFVDTVALERGLPRDEVMEVADGRVFTGTRALELGLIDGIGDLYHAVHVAAGMAGIEGEPTLVKPPKKRQAWLDYVLDSISENVLNKMEGRRTFQYRWKPEYVR